MDRGSMLVVVREMLILSKSYLIALVGDDAKEKIIESELTDAIKNIEKVLKEC